jgi:pyridoxine kinase
MARVLAISSHVARGHVGLAATVPALQSLGHEVWALPTVIVASRPGLGRMARHELPAAALAGMLAALDADGCWPSLDAVLTGYFASPEAVAAAAQAIRRIRAVNPRALVLVDPVLGDAGRLYVPPEVADAIRRELLPLATVATPNLYELQWLTAMAAPDIAAVAQAAGQLGPARVVVTSAAEADATVTTLMVTGRERIERTARTHAGIPNGAGDLFAGLLLGHLLMGRADGAALDAALATLERVLATSAGYEVLQLSALKS